jgi:hypothetical protein
VTPCLEPGGRARVTPPVLAGQHRARERGVECLLHRGIGQLDAHPASQVRAPSARCFDWSRRATRRSELEPTTPSVDRDA